MESILLEILERIRAGRAVSEKDLLRILNDHNRELRLEVRHYSKKKLLPFYLRTKDLEPDRWASWSITPEEEAELVRVLQVKPRRSASGVATITVITKPWKCSGACIYCPNDLRMPKSYLSDEPACQRAERNYFDPYLQVASRLRALKQMGHVTDKIELIVLGGSWSDYPKDYQIWFITELFRALNEGGEYAKRRRTFYKEAGLSYEKEDLVAFTRAAQEKVDAGRLTYNQAAAELYEHSDPWMHIAPSQCATLQDLQLEHKRNETAEHRVVGLVVETRPLNATAENLALLRTLGCTKLQMGIQSLNPAIHEANKRAISVPAIERALDLTRLFGFKTHTHFMVNLMGATPEMDKADFKRFVTQTPYQPDEIKLYPCALVKGTELCNHFKDGSWQPYDEETLVDVLVADVLETPAFTRISRMIRDFSAHDIVAGNKKVNLRQLVEQRAEALAKGAERPIQEIRFREISTSDVEPSDLTLDIVSYETTSTHEHFLQWVTPENKIAGFLRLSLPKPEAFSRYEGLPVMPGEAMIREVHVYGRASQLHTSSANAQHRGLGKKLVAHACQIARDAGYAKLNVISSVGTREYYRNLGFSDNGLYQQKAL